MWELPRPGQSRRRLGVRPVVTRFFGDSFYWAAALWPARAKSTRLVSGCENLTLRTAVRRGRSDRCKTRRRNGERESVVYGSVGGREFDASAEPGRCQQQRGGSGGSNKPCRVITGDDSLERGVHRRAGRRGNQRYAE